MIACYFRLVEARANNDVKCTVFMRTYNTDGFDFDASVEGYVDQQLFVIFIASQRWSAEVEAIPPGPEYTLH